MAVAGSDERRGSSLRVRMQALSAMLTQLLADGSDQSGMRRMAANPFLIRLVGAAPARTPHLRCGRGVRRAVEG